MNEDTRELLRRYADELTAHHPMPGGVLTVVEPDGVSTIPFGTRDLATSELPRVDDVFQIGSISKAFTAYALVRLAAQGALTLDDPVRRHLPWLEVGPWTDAITLRQLLSHTAGLVMGGEGLPDPLALAWELQYRATAEPGQHFHYSNHGYLLLGLVVTAVTGEPLATVVTRDVLEPMGIAPHALARITHDDRDRFAAGYVAARDDRPWVPGDALVAAEFFEMDGADGCLATDAAGLADYLRFLLGDGAALAPGLLAEIGTPTAPDGEEVLVHEGYPTVEWSRYGLGLNVEQVGGHRLLTHGGGNVGYASFVLADRTAGIAVGVLSNADGDNPVAHRLARVAHQVVLQTRGGDLPGPLPPPDPRVHAVPSAWSGSFRSGETVLEVRESAGGVVLDCAGARGRLWSTPTGRYLTDHPALREYRLDTEGDERAPRWRSGPDEFTAGSKGDLPAHPRATALVGQYRSWTPWFPTLRIIARAGRLWLVAPGGVEAPGVDEELTETSPGVWRIGTDSWRPERLIEVGEVDGRVVVLDRDGARYSRTLIPAPTVAHPTPDG